jgi:hypothetical protein
MNGRAAPHTTNVNAPAISFVLCDKSFFLHRRRRAKALRYGIIATGLSPALQGQVQLTMLHNFAA